MTPLPRRIGPSTAHQSDVDTMPRKTIAIRISTKTPAAASHTRTKSPNTGFQRPAWPPMRACATSRRL